MAARNLFRTLPAALLLAAPLALSFPGVRVQADPVTPATEPTPEAASCQVGGGQVGGEPGAPVSGVTAASLAELQKRLQAELAADGEPPITLNGGGYGYAAPRSAIQQLDQLRRESAARKPQP